VLVCKHRYWTPLLILHIRKKHEEERKGRGWLAKVVFLFMLWLFTAGRIYLGRVVNRGGRVQLVFAVAFCTKPDRRRPPTEDASGICGLEFCFIVPSVPGEREESKEALQSNEG